MLRKLLPIVFCPALFATPLLDIQPRPELPGWSANPPADPARDAVLAACGALFDYRNNAPRNCWFTVSETSVIRGLILRKGGPFDSTPPPTDWNDAFPFAMMGCGAVALGFVWRGRGSAAAKGAPGRRP